MGVASDFGVRLLAEVAAAAARPLPVKKQAGRPRTHPHPVQVAPLHRAAAVLASQPETAWHTITWRRGSTGPLTKQFSALRVRRGHADQTGPEGWLIGERPLPGQEGDPSSIGAICRPRRRLARLAELAHRRPGVERGYQDGKGQTGLGDYVARVWHSFHRQLTIEMLVHSWLLLAASTARYDRDCRRTTPDRVTRRAGFPPTVPIRSSAWLPFGVRSANSCSANWSAGWSKAAKSTLPCRLAGAACGMAITSPVPSLDDKNDAVVLGRFMKFKNGFLSGREAKTQRHKTAGDLMVLLPKTYSIMSAAV